LYCSVEVPLSTAIAALLALVEWQIQGASHAAHS
jgi:hypothetical protein